jgi:Putative threonine efflux protein
MSVLGITDVWLYAAAVTVFVLIPGPGMLSLLTASARGGARAGWATWAGLVAGEQLFILAAALGVAAALAAHPLLFAALQWAGWPIWPGSAWACCVRAPAAARQPPARAAVILPTAWP